MFLPENVTAALDLAVRRPDRPVSYDARMALAAREAARALVRGPAGRAVEEITVPFDGHGDSGGVEREAAEWTLREGAPELDGETAEAVLDAVVEVADCALAAWCGGFENNEGAYGTVTLRPAAGPDAGDENGPVTIDITYRDSVPVNGLNERNVLDDEEARQVLAPYRELLESVAARVGPCGRVYLDSGSVVGELPSASHFGVWASDGLDGSHTSGPDVHELCEMAAALSGHLLADAPYDELDVSLTLEMPDAGKAGSHGFPIVELRVSVFANIEHAPQCIRSGWPALRPEDAVALTALMLPVVAPALLSGEVGALAATQASRRWAEALAPAERLGLALQQHGVVAGPLADPATVLAVVPGSRVEVRAARSGEAPVRLHAVVGLDGLRRLFNAGLPLAGLDLRGQPVDIVDALPAGGDGLWRVRCVHAGRDAPAVAWGYARLDDATGHLVVAATREALSDWQRAQAAAVLD